ncbi:hypothetical protein E2562_020496 [Oryza meyeriana var. granulata]|uniref:Uncharacterized protein n=1 Tax=Oryza meyeriana var. granulata TaxID=110450 RepID=A0A6G1D6G5_9ORYZ|nr:hypothetical protein E2562_020496 [Oryza meyeriana var. granulata]
MREAMAISCVHVICSTNSAVHISLSRGATPLSRGSKVRRVAGRRSHEDQIDITATKYELELSLRDKDKKISLSRGATPLKRGSKVP